MVDAKIIDTREDVLFKRKMVKAEIDLGSTTTPSREQVKDIIAKLSNADESLILVESIKKAYGKSQAFAVAKIYSDRVLLEKTEAKYILKRNKIEKTQEAKGKREEVSEQKTEKKKPLGEKPSEEKNSTEKKQEEII